MNLEEEPVEDKNIENKVEKGLDAEIVGTGPNSNIYNLTCPFYN